MAQNVVNAIKGGQLDGFIGDLDNAITARINAQASKRAPAAKKTTPAPVLRDKKVSAAPKREKRDPIKPKENKTYKVIAPPKLKGAKAKYIRPKSDDDTKGMFEMVTEKPGFPKGKRVILPLSALEE